MKPFFPDKGVNTGKITLIEDNEITSVKILEAVIKQTFLFQYVEISEVDEEIINLKTNSASDPYGIIKLYSNICNEPLKDIANNLETSIFDAKLKYANIIPINKKDETTENQIIALSVFFRW